MTTSTGPVSATEIASLLAWARSLSDTGNTDPAERAAYQTAKTTLLARITQHTDPAPIPDSTKDDL